MAIILEANYSKKIGLAGYSSHQFSVTLKTEIIDLAQVQPESERLYHQLQESVDHSIQDVGWLPEQNGKTNGSNGTNGSGKTNGNGSKPTPKPEMWLCTPRQKDLILKIVEENQLDKKEIEGLAQDRFSKGVKNLNMMQASQLIKELLEKYPGNGNGNGNGRTYNRIPTRTAA